jgi:5,10-methenyltetrahydromethanopterin hydrogenase
MNTTQTQTKEFKVQVHQQCTIWTTSFKYIEANSQEEADKLAIDMYHNGELFENLEDFEYVYDSVHETETIDILNQDGNTILKTY